MITNRYAKANNPVLDGYDPNKDNGYLIYLDANNLYGWAMSQEFPVGNCEWKDDIKHFDAMNIPDNSNKGYILGVDLSNFVTKCYSLIYFWCTYIFLSYDSFRRKINNSGF